VVVRLGAATGAGRLQVLVPSMGLEQTLTFTVSPGRAVGTRVTPRDSVIYLNTAAHLTGAVVDRKGNARPDAATLAVSGPLALAGDLATGTAYGVGTAKVTAPGLPADSTRVMVVPHGTLAAVTSYRGSTVALFDLDGSQRTNLAFTAQVNGMDWAPDGTRLVVSLGDAIGPRKLYSVTTAGAQTQLFVGSALTDAFRPVFSANGEWMYFVGSTVPVGFGQTQVWRARTDGTGLERVGTEPDPVKSVAPSPDGSRVAYTRASLSDPLQILTVATGQLAPLSVAAEGVRWSPTAARLSLRQIGGPATVNADGTGFRTYTEYHGLDDPFAPWSPDGSWIAYDNGGSLELIQVDTGLRIPLPYTGGFTQPAWKH
jgi:dipeptidyl aminopeptidase/acylaminoacyl peptidase